MARGGNAHHVGSDDLGVTTLAVLGANEGHEPVVDLGTAGQKESGTRGEGVEEEEFLLLQ